MGLLFGNYLPHVVKNTPSIKPFTPRYSKMVASLNIPLISNASTHVSGVPLKESLKFLLLFYTSMYVHVLTYPFNVVYVYIYIYIYVCVCVCVLLLSLLSLINCVQWSKLFETLRL